MECKRIIENWDRERHHILEENQKLEYISEDTKREIEKKNWQNEKLLIKLALCYAELDRLSKNKLTGS